MDHQPATSNIISMVESVLRQAAQGPPVWQRQHIGFIDHRSASTGDLSVLSGASVDSPSTFSEQRALSPADEQYDGLNDNDNGSEDSPSSSDSGGCGSKKAGNARPNRDPMSHRIIEKRRRDRMNNCLTNLSKLIPSSYLKKGRGRIEKTEIIEMAIRYMRSMQEERKRLLTAATAAAADQPKTEATSCSVKDEASAATAALLNERYKQGFYDCIAETLRFLAGADGLTINEATKTHLLVHLRDYFSQLICDILGAPIIAQLLQISQAPSVVQHSPQHSIRSRSLSFDHSLPDHSRSLGHHEDDQPLNMSLKKPRLDQPSHLRHILTDAKADPIEVRRPHVFRYAAELSKLSPAIEMKPSLPHSVGASGVSAASGSTHYPSSPSSDSQQSLSGSGSSAGDSPPRVVSPFPSSSHQLPAHLGHAGIPVFALHSSGMFYVPLTLSPSQVDPSSVHRLTSTMGACHPVTITVSFCNSPMIADCGLQQPAHHEPDTTKN